MQVEANSLSLSGVGNIPRIALECSFALRDLGHGLRIVQIGEDRLAEAVAVFVHQYNADHYGQFGTSLSWVEAMVWARTWWPRMGATAIELDGEFVGCAFWILAWSSELSLRIPFGYESAADWDALVAARPAAIYVGTKTALRKDRLSARQCVVGQGALIEDSFRLAGVPGETFLVSGMRPQTIRLYRMYGVEVEEGGAVIDPRAPGLELRGILVRGSSLPRFARRIFPARVRAR